jgi:hypothetical protein
MFFWGIRPRPQTAAAKHIEATSWRAAVAMWANKESKKYFLRVNVEDLPSRVKNWRALAKGNSKSDE